MQTQTNGRKYVLGPDDEGSGEFDLFCQVESEKIFRTKLCLKIPVPVKAAW